jgi:hypothetical protein
MIPYQGAPAISAKQHQASHGGLRVYKSVSSWNSCSAGAGIIIWHNCIMLKVLKLKSIPNYE